MGVWTMGLQTRGAGAKRTAISLLLETLLLAVTLSLVVVGAIHAEGGIPVGMVNGVGGDNASADNATSDNETTGNDTNTGGEPEPVVVCDDRSVRLDLEEPLDGSQVSGISNLRGWAFSETSTDRIELLVDGEYRFNIPHGGARRDVSLIHPTYPQAAHSGFSMAFNHNLLTAEDSHTFTVRAFNTEGGCSEATVAVDVQRLSNPFYPGADAMDLSDARVDLVDNVIVIRTAQFGSTASDIHMAWDKGMQKFGVRKISVYDLDQLTDINGKWAVVFNLSAGVEGNIGEPICSGPVELNREVTVTHSGSLVTVSQINPLTNLPSSTVFEYVGEHPLFGLRFVGQQVEDLLGGQRITDWDLNVSNGVVSGGGPWLWSDGQNQCSGTITVSGTKS